MIRTKLKIMITMMAVQIILALSMIGCGFPEPNVVNPVPPVVSPVAGVEQALVNAEGEAWIDVGYGERSDGFILKSNGDFEVVTNATGSWTRSGIGKVSAEDGVIVAIQGQYYYGFEPGIEAQYVLTSNGAALEITKDGGHTETFVKRSGVEISGTTPPTLLKSSGKM